MKKTDFTDSWRFGRTGEMLRPVSVPHDAMLLEQRKQENPSGSGSAYFGSGCYEYEKEFTLPECSSAVLLFEGIYPMGEIFLDGRKAAFAHYGYGDCFVDCSCLADGKVHTVHVTVDNTKTPNSRWYSGAGLYRPVWLFTGDENHILPEGIRVSTLSHDPAVIRVQTAHKGGDVRLEILEDGQIIATAEGDDVTIEIPNAKLWAAEHPNLYTCRAYAGADSAEVRFGIRTLAWNQEGFFVNGNSVKFKGGCIHHDNGVIGARSYAVSEYRRMAIMKSFGFNAVRSSHHPMCRSLLDACDELGLYVMDESWDMWYSTKTEHDYAARFEDHWQEDVVAMVAKDYVHPSVVMYSIGNEVTEPVEEKGIRLVHALVEKFHELDASRPATAGVNPALLMMRKMNLPMGGQVESEEKKEKVTSTEFNKMVSEMGKRMTAGASRPEVDEAASPFLDGLDIAGYNYATSCYEVDAVRHPGRLMVGTETFPQDLPVNWALVEKLPYLYGDFMWTAWDYLGEVGIGSWYYGEDDPGFGKPCPWLLGDAGAIDILGNDTAEAGLASVVWGARKTPYLSTRPVNRNAGELYQAIWRGTNAVPSWSWRDCEGRIAEVEVYSNAQEIELLLNGASLGRAKVNAEFRAEFKVPYAPGKLTAIAYRDGKVTGESSLESASGAVSIRAVSEGKAIPGQPLYVDIDLVGENGIVECNRDTTLTVTVEGAELLGFGSANPKTSERFETGTYTTYYGRSQAVLLPNAQAIRMTVTGERMESCTLELHI